MTFFGSPGAALERWTGSVTLDGTWDYDRFFDATTPNDSKLHLNGQFTFRGGWSFATSLLIESFKYPPELYANYFIEAPTGLDTIPYVGTDRLANLDAVLSISTPQFQTFSANAFLVYGRDENFFEWATADIALATVNVNWLPTEQLRVNFRYSHTQYIRPNDRSNVGLRRIPRLKAEYQLSRSIFIRLVGQYDANFVDALRDNSRTENPILIYSKSTDTFTPAVANTSNNFRVDWFFSFRPTPGTVLFLGYGASLNEARSFRFRALQRSQDAFFVKLSYLWRVKFWCDGRHGPNKLFDVHLRAYGVKNDRHNFCTLAKSSHTGLARSRSYISRSRPTPTLGEVNESQIGFFFYVGRTCTHARLWY